MLLKEIYKIVVTTGIEADPRGKEAVMKDLEMKQATYEDLRDDEKEFFDMESLKNPYADSRILYGTGEEDIRTSLVGIDMEMSEILLADRLGSRGEKVDLVLSHHPEGKAFANFYEVMHMQADILNRVGVPVNVAEDLVDIRTKEVERRVSPVNHTRAVDVARLLDIPFMCVHTPADNMVASYLNSVFDEKRPERLSDVQKILREIPEYREATRSNAGPKILLGSKERKAGKIFVDMTGGTEGPKDIFESLVNSGVNTIVAMHISEDHRKEAEKRRMNVIVAGHISSDNIGMNLLLDEIQKSSDLKVLTCSGFRRFSRL
ncbi:NGG1p interacting factor NIF3 [bacterium]|nr:MAG: NGG1p interacting factor NIF3 [bacterium]